MKTPFIFLPVWGDAHIELMQRVLFMSLRWPLNEPFLKNATWIILTDSVESQVRITSHVREFFADPQFIYYVVPELKTELYGLHMMNAIRESIPFCVEQQRPFIMCLPDMIYANGTIRAMLKVGAQAGTVVSFAHPRVEQSILDELEGKAAPTNGQLVTLSWKHPHFCWTHAQIDIPVSNCCFDGGMSWQVLGANVIGVTHRLPTPLLCNFVEGDIALFNSPDTEKLESPFGYWDWVWPKHLLQEGRLRYIGSSDAAFMVEVTHPNANMPKLRVRNDEEPDAFRFDDFHHEIQRQFVAVFRGE